jgi:TonB family protein
MTAWYSFLAGAALKSILVLGAAGLLAILLRRASSSTRHLLWTAAFAGLLALPLLTITLPTLPAPRMFRPNAIFRTDATSQGARNVMPSLNAPQQPSKSPFPAVSHRPNLPLAAILVWAAGAVISFAQMAIAWLGMARTRRKARPFPALQVEDVAVLETPPGSMPITFGLLRPTVFLPADAANWPEERLRIVLLHELAHVRRGDIATHLLARAAVSLYWWNPLAWMAWRSFVRERERAADDLVLSAGARPSDYAGHLLEIARSMQAAPRMDWAAIAMARRSQLEGRLLAILDSGVNRRAPQRAAGWIAALTAIALIAPLAALRAQDTQTVPADASAVFRAAAAQQNPALLEGPAKAAEAYSQFDLARKLLDSSLALREQISGQQSAAYGVGLLKIADLERDRHNNKEAEAFYTKAVSVLGNRPEAAPALISLGLLAMHPDPNNAPAGNLQKAFDDFSQAQTADPSKAGMALMWMAVVRGRQHDDMAAEQLFQQALAVEDPHSRDAATTMQVYATALQKQGREDEANSYKTQASAIRKELDAHSTQFRQTAGVTPYRVGNGVTPPTLAYKIEPQYSEEARAAAYQGTVVVSTTIGADGTAQNMQVIRSLGMGLDEKALQAISQWKFKPGTKDGQPVPVQATIEVNFRLL